MNGTGGLKLMIGSGYSHIEGFKRLDIDPRTEPDFTGDAAELTKIIGEDMVDEIRAHHILEHFYINQAFGVCREWWKALKPGGRLEVAVPDCGYAAVAFAACRIDSGQYVKLLAGADQMANEWMVHKNFFTMDRLERLLFITGFVRVQDIRKKPDELLYEAFRPEENKWQR